MSSASDQTPHRLGIFARISNVLAPKRSPAAVPEGMRVYAVGDIHGCVRELDDLMAVILADNQASGLDTRLVFLGDYLDRGPDSKGVIARLLLPPDGYKAVHLMGNHDQTLLDFLNDPIVYRSWRGFGAQETLMSYGVRPPRFDDEEEFILARQQLAQAMPPDHIDFLRNLQGSIQIGDYFFVHAGVRPGIALDQQVAADTLWIRDEFLDSNHNFGSVIVHGHTPVESGVRRTNRINVDTGAYATGRLTAAVLEGHSCRFLST